MAGTRKVEVLVERARSIPRLTRNKEKFKVIAKS
jgi:hypothetical protein